MMDVMLEHVMVLQMASLAVGWLGGEKVDWTDYGTVD